jgi:hypothetical protein
MTVNTKTVLIAAAMVALFSAGAFAAGNAARGVTPPVDAKECGQLVKDTSEMLNETEVSPETDQAVEGLIKEAKAQCGAGQFAAATDAVVQARALLTQE